MKRRNRRQAALSLLPLAMALAAAPSARADAPQDTLLSLFYGGKLGLSVLAAGTALTEPDMSARERLVVGGSAALVGASSALVLACARQQRPAALRRWRMTAFAIDAALSALAIGTGLSIWANRDSTLSDDYAGLAFVLLGATGAIVSAADLAPFDVERRRGRPPVTPAAAGPAPCAAPTGGSPRALRRPRRSASIPRSRPA